ncbi:MAG TPA: type 3 dihydrofolate reductase [Steroidobacteraceae bacterium]|nr:type 3 dihydrofolate reductase [Steroidobacteraceae bacterium]
MISIIVAVAENGVIGSNNRLPWHLPDDLKRFKALSLGKPIVMGRRTFDSIGRPLPGRTNIVISRQSKLVIAGTVVVLSLDDALIAASAAPEIVVIGGAEIFKQVLPRTNTIHLTRVHARVAGDVFFPELDPLQWREAAVEHHDADERHQYAFSFVTLQRNQP